MSPESSSQLLWLKAFHVMAVISWMAGQFYIWRLYVYHAMATDPAVMRAFEVMERRLLNAITTPAAILSLFTGIGLLALEPFYLEQPWMQIKLLALVVMYAAHGFSIRFRKKLLTEPNAYPHQLFRFLNELPTVLMIVIVIMVIVKPFAR
ncbi:MAG TPA: protoporphyrinogen oxidase HemJ [Myxococcaceae bacterium]|nr:protoporphyrinogen oxidase HemJ [Myxococcaceae bacterium]